eukprot:gene3443-3771_t
MTIAFIKAYDDVTNVSDVNIGSTPQDTTTDLPQSIEGVFNTKTQRQHSHIEPWERRAMPVPHGTDEFIPSYGATFIENGYKIRVDLPGMREFKVLLNSTPSLSSLPSYDHDWVLVVVDSRDEQYRVVHVLGYRQRPKDDHSSVFGKFHIVSKVSYAYYNPKVTLDNGELNIVWERVK